MFANLIEEIGLAIEGRSKAQQAAGEKAMVTQMAKKLRKQGVRDISPTYRVKPFGREKTKSQEKVGRRRSIASTYGPRDPLAARGDLKAGFSPAKYRGVRKRIAHIRGLSDRAKIKDKTPRQREDPLKKKEAWKKLFSPGRFRSMRKREADFELRLAGRRPWS